MAKALTSIVTLIMVVMIMVSIVQSIPDAIGGGGQTVQLAYTTDLESNSPSQYAQSILSNR